MKSAAEIPSSYITAPCWAYTPLVDISTDEEKI